MANFLSYADATTIFTDVGNKLKALSGAYVIKGSIAFASIPSTLTAAMNGYVYNITDQFTTDSRFIDGTGRVYPAGTNIVVVNAGSAATPDMKLDVMGSFVDVAGIESDINDVSDSITADDFDSSQAYSVGDIVKYENKLYKFKTAHTANDPWDATEVDEVTVLALIDDATPRPLTTDQTNAIIALLG